MVLLAGAWLARDGWLRWLGEFLVDAEAPVAAEVAVVLGGDYKGERILYAADLAQKGLTRHILVSGISELYGRPESELAIEYAIRRGYSAAYFEALHLDVQSTADEARQIPQILKSRGVRSFLLITSNFHTRRAGRLFRRYLDAALTMHVVAAPDRYFDPARWWLHREGRKICFYEWTKTISQPLENP